MQIRGTTVSGSQRIVFLQYSSPLHISASPGGTGGGEAVLEGEQSSWIGICHVTTKIPNHYYDFSHKIVI